MVALYLHSSKCLLGIVCRNKFTLLNSVVKTQPECSGTRLPKAVIRIAALMRRLCLQIRELIVWEILCDWINFYFPCLTSQVTNLEVPSWDASHILRNTAPNVLNCSLSFSWEKIRICRCPYFSQKMRFFFLQFIVFSLCRPLVIITAVFFLEEFYNLTSHFARCTLIVVAVYAGTLIAAGSSQHSFFLFRSFWIRFSVHRPFTLTNVVRDFCHWTRYLLGECHKISHYRLIRHPS
jgi:hypothetical protein